MSGMFNFIMRLNTVLIVVAMTMAACTADPSGDSGAVASPPASAEGQPDAEAIRPFTIEIADEVLEDLNDRLARDLFFDDDRLDNRFS